MTTKTAETKDLKDAASGYAGLSAGVLVNPAELGTGTPTAAKYLRGDSTWQTVPARFFKQTEIDFTTSARQKKFSVADADALAGDKIWAVHSGDAATGRSSDENELDALIVRGVCLVNGTITFYVDSLFGPVMGKYKLNYGII